MTPIDRPAASAASAARLEGTSRPDADRPVRRTAAAATVLSGALAGLGATWLLAPELNPLDDGMLSLASALLGSTAVATLTIVLGVAGVVLAAVVLPRAGDRGAIGGAAAAIALITALALGSMSTVAIAGYLFGLAAVVVGIATIGTMLVRAPRWGWSLLGGLALVLALAVWWAGLTVEGVAEFAVAFGGALAEDVGLFGATGVVLATTLVWTAIAVSTLRASGAGHAIEAWLVAHRRPITILAGLGPVPYAVARVSWLTPWPLFAPEVEDLEPAILATGLMLGSGGVAASILTLGLILPWGRRFPRWMPRIGGRAVPVAAAAVPGFAAAGVLCISAVPTLVTSFTGPSSPVDALSLNLVLPLWFWGPMLALAVGAYVAWRADEARGDRRVADGATWSDGADR
jgi:hypothetical protein